MKKKEDVHKKLQDRKISVEVEFQALRSEILSWQSCDTNVMIYMYVLSVTLIGFSIQFKNSLLLFLIYFILFLFESMLLSFRRATARLSAYIVVFLQVDRDEFIYWESSRLYLQSESKDNTIVTPYFLAQQGSKILATFSFVFIAFCNINEIVLFSNCILYVAFMIFSIISHNYVDSKLTYYIKLFEKIKNFGD